MLTNFPPNDYFDLPIWMGQRSSTFRFALVNGVTGEHLGDITPIRGATLTHDSTRTIKRQLNMALGQADTAAVNPVTDRIDVYFIESTGTEWPLGRYMFTDDSRNVFTSGDMSTPVLNDEMFLVDQEITSGINASGTSIAAAIADTLSGLPIEFEMDPSPFIASQSWSIGNNRGSILESLAIAGDLFSPWFGNDKKMHFIRTFNPANQIPDFDFDTGYRVYRDNITKTSELLTAPNRFVVISNSPNNRDVQVVATADVPTNAPHSIANRGFVIADVQTLQLSDAGQAVAVAQGLANRQTVFETATVTTAPDPRHDAYNVIQWQGDRWLELGWSMSLVEGGAMVHRLRKGYS